MTTPQTSPHSVSCYRPSNPSNLQQQQAVFDAGVFHLWLAVLWESRESKTTKAKLVMIVASCPRIQTPSRHCFLGAVAYASNSISSSSSSRQQ